MLGVVADRAMAQTKPDTAARNIEPVNVRGSRVPLVTGGASAIVVRPDSLPIPLMPSPSLDQVLRQSAFVLVRQNSRGEIELSVRGSDSRQATVLLDGLPMTLGWDHRSDPSLIPTTGIDRITITRGLSSLLAGPNSLGGVIQLELNAPMSRRGAQTASSLRVGTGLDQYAGRVFSATGVAPRALGNGTLRVRGGATFRERDGFALSGGDAGDGITGGAVDPGDARNAELRTNTDLKQLDGFAAVRYDHTNGAFVGFTGAANTSERGVAPEQHIKAPRYWRYPQQSRQLGIISAGSGVRSTPIGAGSLEASVGVNRSDLEIESYSNRTYSVVSTRESGDEQSNVARVQATHSLPFAGELRLGGTFSAVRYDETLDAQLASSTASRYEQRLSSVGIEAEFPIFSRLLVSGGVVNDEARSPQTGGKPTLGTMAKSGWRVGSTLLVNEAVRLHASASRRARFPSLRELYSGALNRFDPNPLLRPENLLGYEAGITLAGGALEQHGLQLQAVGFRHNLDDAVIRITLPNRLFRRENRDNIRSSGLEALAVWAPIALRGASFSADATVQKIRVYDLTITTSANNERRAEHNPERRASVSFATPLVAAIHGSVMARHTGAQFCQHPDLGRLVELKPQTVGDAALTRGFTVRRGGLLQRLMATMAMENVGNQTVYDQCGLPQPGRTLRVGFELR